eukprot:CAMPEP_0182448530 /NCGR_PEP_ID=MMETSP1172-20130603/27878_1 /TAXON_ID=708627 /ORGANISM="Timspurckia oligopyrenoides, Strain CCMP3278" /LENGTH=393 /DNA_ID=CAMNT_0024645439 /DNA_START=39 /DNA_END=1220 /DNA_ORIENTATION=+
MGRCAECRKQTQNFCFVHQEFICPASLVASDAHDLCVVGSYRKWVQDSAYPWPPQCSMCSNEIKTDENVIRLTCLHILHAKCLVESPPPQGACSICRAIVVPPPNDTTPLAQKLRAQLSDASWFPSPITPVPQNISLESNLPSDSVSVQVDQPDQTVNDPAAHSQNANLDESVAHQNGLDVAVQVLPTESADGVSAQGRSTGEGSEQTKVSDGPMSAPSSVVKSRGVDGTASSGGVVRPLDLESGGSSTVDGSLVDMNGVIGRPAALRSIDDDDKSRKYRKATIKRAMNEVLRRWLAVKRLLRKHRRQVIATLFGIIVVFFVSWLVFGGDNSEPLPERASHNFERLEHGIEDEVKGLEQGIQDRISKDVEKLKTVHLANPRFKRTAYDAEVAR